MGMHDNKSWSVSGGIYLVSGHAVSMMKHKQA